MDQNQMTQDQNVQPVTPSTEEEVEKKEGETEGAPVEAPASDAAPQEESEPAQG